jgi:hypothetical protein
VCIWWDVLVISFLIIKMTSWPWLYGSWIYNYIWNQCISLLTLWVRIPLRRGVLDTVLWHNNCQLLPTGRWFYVANISSVICTLFWHNMYRGFHEEVFEDTKGVISIRKSKKNRQHNGQKKKCKRRNNDLHCTKYTHKTKDRVTRIPLKTEGELRYSERYGIHCHKNTWMSFRSNSRIYYFPLQVLG